MRFHGIVVSQGEVLIAKRSVRQSTSFFLVERHISRAGMESFEAIVRDMVKDVEMTKKVYYGQREEQIDGRNSRNNGKINVVTIRKVLATLPMVLVMLRMELVHARQLRQVHKMRESSLSSQKLGDRDSVSSAGDPGTVKRIALSWDRQSNNKISI